MEPGYCNSLCSSVLGCLCLLRAGYRQVGRSCMSKLRVLGVAACLATLELGPHVTLSSSRGSCNPLTPGSSSVYQRDIG